MAVVLAISDLHAPYHHPNALDFLKSLKKEFKPTRIVCLGDEVDCHSLSVHPKHPMLYSAGHEYEAAMEFMHKLYKLFPVVDVCISNHTHTPIVLLDIMNRWSLKSMASKPRPRGRATGYFFQLF